MRAFNLSSSESRSAKVALAGQVSQVFSYRYPFYAKVTDDDLKGPALFRYILTDKGRKQLPIQPGFSIAELREKGFVDVDAITYEHFLPVMAERCQSHSRNVATRTSHCDIVTLFIEVNCPLAQARKQAAGADQEPNVTQLIGAHTLQLRRAPGAPYEIINLF